MQHDNWQMAFNEIINPKKEGEVMSFKKPLWNHWTTTYLSTSFKGQESNLFLTVYKILKKLFVFKQSGPTF